MAIRWTSGAVGLMTSQVTAFTPRTTWQNKHPMSSRQLWRRF